MGRALIVFVVVVACGGAQPQPTPAKSGDQAMATPIPDPTVEALVKDTIGRVARGDTTAAANLGAMFVLGGGIWPELIGTEKACCPAKELYTLGTRSFIAHPKNPTRGWESRTYVDEKDREKLVGLKPFVTLATVFKDAKARPANEAERRFFYALYPMEIAGKPLTILEHEKGVRLVVYVESGKIAVLDGMVGYDESKLVDIAK